MVYICTEVILVAVPERGVFATFCTYIYMHVVRCWCGLIGLSGTTIRFYCRSENLSRIKLFADAMCTVSCHQAITGNPIFLTERPCGVLAPQ